MARVAHAFATDFWTVAEWPWVDVKIAEQSVEELEYVASLRAERDRIELANLLRVGMWSEDGLGRAERAWERQLLVAPRESQQPAERTAWLKSFRDAEARGNWRKAT